jgi:signal transduction histidine kinase
VNAEVRTRLARGPSLRTPIRVAWLAVVVILLTGNVSGDPWSLALVVAGAAAWLAWMGAEARGRPAVGVVALALLGSAGGLLAPHASFAIAFLAVVGIASGSTLAPLAALVLSACGPACLGILTLAEHRSAELLAWACLVAAGAFVGGLSRRQAQEHTRQAALVGIEHEKAELAQAQAAVLAERNRIAREVHDVLAHTLSALAVQLEAADTVREHGDSPERLAELLRRSRRLVADGLDETRAAVRALRDEPVQLVEQLAALAQDDSVELQVHGEPRPLAPEPGLALYRAVQEAVTNARKHAPGARAAIAVDFGTGATTVTVTNDPSAAHPLGTGDAGFGLQGMRERIELAGGRLDAGPDGGGWTVRATVPS